MQPNPKELENSIEFHPYIGRTIGAYTLQSIVGVGGMGAVFVATHNRLDKRVAVKLIKSSLRDQKEAAKRFFSEAKAAAAVGHENIIDVFDVGEDTELGPYLAMELLEAAESLGAVIVKEAPLPLARVAKITLQASRALFATHAAGLVHCDLKPSNILLIKALGQKDVVKLIDFGIAREAPSANQDPLVSSKMVLGTPKFMSPEQVIGRRPDGRSDQYALGILVYAMLTGKPPFEGTPGEVMKRQYHDPPAQLTAKRQDVTQQLEEIIFRALAKKPDERFPSIQQFGETLHETIDKLLRPRTSPRLPISANQPPSGPNKKIDLDAFRDMFEEGDAGNTGDHPKLEAAKEPPKLSLSDYKDIFDAEGGHTGAVEPLPKNNSTAPAEPNKAAKPSLADYKAMFDAEGGHTGAVAPLAPPKEPEKKQPSLADYKAMFENEGGHTGAVEPLSPKPAQPNQPVTPQPSLSHYKAMFENEGGHTGAVAPLTPPKAPEKKDDIDIFSLVSKQTPQPTPPTPTPITKPLPPTEPLPAKSEEPKEQTQPAQTNKPKEDKEPATSKVLQIWAAASLALFMGFTIYWSYLSGYVGGEVLPQYEIKPRQKKVVPSFTPETAPSIDLNNKDTKLTPRLFNNKTPEPTTAPNVPTEPTPEIKPEIKPPEQIEVPDFNIPDAPKVNQP